MRYTRHDMILDIIKEYEVETQDKLASILRERGFDVTQATVSRDIKELQLIKVLGINGKYKYATQGTLPESPITDRFAKIFKQTVKSVKFSGNIVVVETLTGCANAAAEAIDSAKFPHIVGTLAGDNTFFIVIDAPENSPKLVEIFNEMLKSR